MALVLWSGGNDSTALICQLAEEECKGQLIKTLSVVCNDVACQIQQKAAREKLLLKFKEWGWNVANQEVHLSFGQDVFPLAKQTGIAQPAVWLSLAAAFLEPDEDLYTGYIATDQMWHRKAEVLNLFDSLCKMSGKGNSLLLFPFERNTKMHIIQMLVDRGIDTLPWTCDSVGEEATEPCGKCTPCWTYKMAKWALDNGYFKG